MRFHNGVASFQNLGKKILFADNFKLLFNFNTVYFIRAKKNPNKPNLALPPSQIFSKSLNGQLKKEGKAWEGLNAVFCSKRCYRENGVRHFSEVHEGADTMLRLKGRNSKWMKGEDLPPQECLTSGTHCPVEDEDGKSPSLEISKHACINSWAV